MQGRIVDLLVQGLAIPTLLLVASVSRANIINVPLHPHGDKPICTDPPAGCLPTIFNQHRTKHDVLNGDDSHDGVDPYEDEYRRGTTGEWCLKSRRDRPISTGAVLTLRRGSVGLAEVRERQTTLTSGRDPL